MSVQDNLREQCAVCSVDCAMYNVHCTIYIVHSWGTVYSVYIKNQTYAVSTRLLHLKWRLPLCYTTDCTIYTPVVSMATSHNVPCTCKTNSTHTFYKELHIQY